MSNLAQACCRKNCRQIWCNQQLPNIGYICDGHYSEYYYGKCARERCKSLGSQTFISPELGYICSDCQQEFKVWLQSRKANPVTRQQINEQLDKFMVTEKGSYRLCRLMNFLLVTAQLHHLL